MKKFIPREKMSRKAKKEIDRRARAVWGISPVSRKKEDKTKYSRKRGNALKDEGFQGIGPSHQKRYFFDGLKSPAFAGDSDHQQSLAGRKKLRDFAFFG